MSTVLAKTVRHSPDTVYIISETNQLNNTDKTK